MIFIFYLHPLLLPILRYVVISFVPIDRNRVLLYDYSLHTQKMISLLIPHLANYGDAL